MAPRPGPSESRDLHSFHLHRHAVSSMQVVNETMYTASYDQTVCKVDLLKGLAVRTFHSGASAIHCVREVDGVLFTGNDAGEIHMMDGKGGQTLCVLTGHRGRVSSLFAEEKTLYTGGDDSILRVWDLKMNKCRKKLKVHTGPITCLRVVGGTIYTGSWDGSVYAYSEQEAAGKRYNNPSDSDPPSVLDLEVVGSFVYATYRDGKARAWALKGAPEVKPTTLFLAHEAAASCVMVDEDARMYTGSDDHTIAVWDLKTTRRNMDWECSLHVYRGHVDGVLCLAKSENLLYSGGYDHTIRIWDAKEIDRRLSPEAIEASIPLHKRSEPANLAEELSDGDISVHRIELLQTQTSNARSDEDPDWWKASRLINSDGRIIPALGIRLDSQQLAPVVAEVFEECTGEKAGLKVGDIICKMNSFDVESFASLKDNSMYLRVHEMVDIVVERQMANSVATREVSLSLSIEDFSTECESDETFLSMKALLYGISDLFDDSRETQEHASLVLEVLEKHIPFLLQVRSKFASEIDPQKITMRSFWQLCKQCRIINSTWSAAEVDKQTSLQRIRQLHPHPRTEDVKSPHDPHLKLFFSEVMMGLMRVASKKYQKLDTVPEKIERFIERHLVPHALGDLGESAQEVHEIEMSLLPEHRRAFARFYTNCCGSRAPVNCLAGDVFIHSFKSMKELMETPGMSGDVLREILYASQRYFVVGDDDVEVDTTPDFGREIVSDEFLYALGMIGKKSGVGSSLADGACEVVDKFIVGHHQAKR